MKKTISSFVLVIYCFTIVQTVIPYLDYIINYDYISEILCINIEKTDLECNGQCYLNEQISMLSDEEKSGQKKILPVERDKFPVIISDLNSTLTEPADSKNQPCLKGKRFLIQSHSSKPPTPPPQS